ncbi:OLC1v1021455C1 [Oldenlandia corymbosa var. corymbosa]|uniref:OLC1v1021455C1 n=1 Tax=Oldenlandia corymbosa var. corymbosa TaxID=529605 RepID=A0AAV1BX69_OLDCO|nr:OLC1v1021455C1 [Oldenlandia corymbosa var. corymbosa]
MAYPVLCHPCYIQSVFHSEFRKIHTFQNPPLIENRGNCKTMEETTWEQRINALTHIITSPTTSPSLHSQYFIATQIPCYLHWDYPPILCNQSSSQNFPSIQLKWALLTYLKRVSGCDFPRDSWRSKCAYQIPPPIKLADGVEEARWGEAERREYVRRRLRRRRLGSDVNPWIPILIPNLFLFWLFFWNPVPEYTGNDR